jgi:hypothetical protein
MKFTNDRLPNKGDRVYVTYGGTTLVGIVKVYNPGTVVVPTGFLDVVVDDGSGDQIVLTLSTSRNFKVSVTEPSLEEQINELPIGARFALADSDHGYYVKVSEKWATFVMKDGEIFESYDISQDFENSDEAFTVIE